MGKVESKQKIKIKAIINCQIKSEIICPICHKLLEGNMTYNLLNNHLKVCDSNLRDIQSVRYENDKIRQKLSEKNLSRNYLNNNMININNKTAIIIKSKLQSVNKMKENIYSSEIPNVNTVNDFQLIIDYNNTKNQDLYEEKLKIDGKNQKIFDKFTQLKQFLLNKKNLMNYDLNIECKNYKEIFISLKKITIYYNLRFILFSGKNSNIMKKKKPKILSLNAILNKYFEYMIKNKYFHLINNTLYFSLNSNTVDYEMLGIIISILIIYPEIKLDYNLPLILCKILVNQRLELNDIKYVNSNLYNNLYFLSRDDNIDNKGLAYFYEGNELLIDGKNIKVNSLNVFDYIEKIINYHIRNYKNRINIIKSSLFEFIPKKYIFYFNGEDIYHIINRL